ncbi:hypothetical protein AB0B30_32470 [Streptomyces narbonensis]|uniref:Uncharacterized protein n=1 Tax=Streptomyces narbonensis TaxID=67333 RepID=A0ABV3CIY4_9ACTN
MDDTNAIDGATYKVTISGTEYEFGQPDPKLLTQMVLVSHMNAGELLTLEAVTKWLASAAGPKAWHAIMKRFMDGDITAQDLMDAMKELVQAVVGKSGTAEDAA